MASPDGKDNGYPPSRSTVSPPASLTENARSNDQEGSSVDLYPFDVETVESGISRLGLGDSVSQNRHRPVESFGVSNSSENVSSSSRTPNPPPDSVRFENLKGKILEYAKDQNNSLFLQQIIDDEENSGHKIVMIFNEVINSVDELMMDHFGFPVFLKLFEKCNGPQIAQIVNAVSQNPNSFANVCTDSIGNIAVQTLLKSVQSQELVSVVGRSLSTIALQLCKSKYGNRVIHCCLEHFSAEDNMSLMSEVAQNSYEIAMDQHGCIVLQLCLSYCMEEQRHCLADIRRRSIGVLLDNALRLAEHSYGEVLALRKTGFDTEALALKKTGVEQLYNAEYASFCHFPPVLVAIFFSNYMVQYLLELRDPGTTAVLLRHFEGSYATLSRDKYGSHVVEKVLTLYGEEHSERIISELIPDFRMLVLDSFGNYVIQAALMVSKNDIRGVLIDKVQENYPVMAENKYGRRVLRNLQEM